MTFPSSPEPSAPTAPTRDKRIRRVVDDCLVRLSAGQSFAEAAVLREHQELLPELAEELRRLRIFAGAFQQAELATAVDPFPSATPQTWPTESTGSHLEVRCPHCHQSTPVTLKDSLADVTCAHCRQHFNLVGVGPVAAGDVALTQLGHFELIDQLGVGGFGTVWKARDKELGRLVAVKIPRRGQLSPTEAEQFLREARAAAQLRHPNIVSVHEVGRDGDRVYIVSDLVDGLSLAERLLEGRLSADEAAGLCRKIAVALEHAHGSGVIHRDLKPANVLLDHDGQPHLTDFGLARCAAEETTVTLDGQMLGTPAYMSPEQARGEAHQADCRTDIYSLGGILYELLTGGPPFRGNTGMLVRQILEEEPPCPRRLDGSIPRDLESICLKCLEKDPAGRYATAQTLADDLGRFLRREPTVARPITGSQRAWRWCRRKPLVSSLIALLFLTLLCGSLGVTWKWREAEQARADEKLARQEAALRAQQIDQDLQRLILSNRLLDQGKTFIGSDRLDDALVVLSRAIELRPDNVATWDRRSDLYFSLGLGELAAADLQQRFAHQEPDVTSLWFAQAVVLAWLNDEVGYRRICARMQDRFTRSQSPIYVADTVRTAVLLPTSNLDPRQLVEWAQALTKHHPGDRLFLFTLAAAYYRAGQLREAVECCLDTLEVSAQDWPTDAAIHSLLALAYHGLGDTENARRALATAENKVNLVIERMYAAGRETWAPNLGAVTFREMGAWDWYEYQVYRREARARLGLPALRDPRISVLRARALAGLRRSQEAAAEYAEALALAPADPQIQMEAHRIRAIQHVAHREFAQAAAAYERARKVLPGESRLWEYQAVALLADGQVDPCRQVCAEMAEQFDKTQWSLMAHNIVVTCTMLPDTLRDTSRLVSLAQLGSQSYSGAVRILGAAHYRAGNYDQAVQWLDKAQQVYRLQPFDLLFLSMAHHRLGHFDQARQYLTQADDWMDRADRRERTDNDFTGNLPAWSGWEERIKAQVLRREAELLISGEPAGSHSR